MADVRMTLTISVGTWYEEPEWSAADGRLEVSIPGVSTHDNVWCQDESVISCRLRWGLDEDGKPAVMLSPEDRKSLSKALPKGVTLSSLVGVCSQHMPEAIKRELIRKEIRQTQAEEEEHMSCMRHDECKTNLQVGRLCYEDRKAKASAA